MTLKEALKCLHLAGEYEDFKDDGVPTVAAVRKLLGRSVSAQEIWEQWFILYGFSTCREDRDQEKTNEA